MDKNDNVNYWKKHTNIVHARYKEKLYVGWCTDDLKRCPTNRYNSIHADCPYWRITFDEFQDKKGFIEKEFAKNSDVQWDINMHLSRKGLYEAKDDSFYCMYIDCIKHELSCKSCPFMVNNFDLLTHLASEFSRLMIDSQQKFKDQNIPKGDKIYLSRMLETYVLKLQQAIEKFGEDIVSEFFTGFDNNLNEVRKRLAILADYITHLNQTDLKE